MPVTSIVHDDGCVLWLWTTNHFMPHAFAVLDRWGFEHKTILTWVKPGMGLGDWLRGNTEHCRVRSKVMHSRCELSRYGWFRSRRPP
jgi:N6-adenosine-specific RNA methylase IME4